MRYNGDDYCYGAMITRYGLLKAQWFSYFLPMPYHGNRYFLTFFSGLSTLFGPYANAVLPGLAIVLWIIGIVFGLHQVARLTRLHLSHLDTLLIAEILVFFSLYQAPNLSQSLYWRSGMLPYLAPIIGNIFLITVLLKNFQQAKIKISALFLSPSSLFWLGAFQKQQPLCRPVI
jgi:hypothetical protein